MQRTAAHVENPAQITQVVCLLIQYKEPDYTIFEKPSSLFLVPYCEAVCKDRMQGKENRGKGRCRRKQKNSDSNLMNKTCITF